MTVADLEIWKGGFKVVGVAHKAAEGGRHCGITRAAEQPKYALKIRKGGAFAPPLPPLNPPLCDCEGSREGFARIAATIDMESFLKMS